MSKLDVDSPRQSETEASLRAEIGFLKAQLAKRSRPRDEERLPSRATLWILILLATVLTAAAFFTGYLPRQHRESLLVTEANTAQETLPVVNVVAVERSPSAHDLEVPGNIQAVTEAPVLARASGYIKRRYVDIGDRVTAGQLLAEIQAPELEQQVQQGKASLEQARASLEQAQANLNGAHSAQDLARVTAQRWANLASRGVVSAQENDQYQAQYKLQTSAVLAQEKAVASARGNVGASEANLARLSELQGYVKVLAPFAGLITVRNVDTGALITEGSTLLFRIAQTKPLRIYINLAQSDSESVRKGTPAKIAIPDLPGRTFAGIITRTAGALDPATRTLLTEVQVPNTDGTLLPGMYALVTLTVARTAPSLLIPGDTIVVRNHIAQVAVVGGDGVVHFRQVGLGRDYGERIEILSGLEAGQRIVVNPGDSIQDGVKVNPSLLRNQNAPQAGKRAAGGSH